MADSVENLTSGEEEEWHPFATFVIEYQYRNLSQQGGASRILYRTSAHNLEEGDSESWQSIEGKPVMDWMLYHVVKHTQGQLKQIKLPPHNRVVELPIRLELEGVTVEDGVGHRSTCQREGYFDGFVSQESPITIASLIRVSKAYKTKYIGYCRTDVFALRLADGKRFMLGSSVPERNSAKPSSLKATLLNVELDAGVYVITVVTLLNHHEPALDYMEASLLVVI